ncbi:hypothetical protein BT63DRAFT_406133 [Microthyrium microscopicum]|uniref:2'-phosphotransferase n=1 Tax=Microthyrium microscopicum TaxID=703497 RepID=A0A6A6TY59_9PEZI|nr:hypothetical protein BT63DRAFT_406133 [Microthyrium microscopicum]
MARGGRNARSGPPGTASRDVQVSKKLSWLLRHGAEKEGLKLDRGGYISVTDVLNNRTIKPLKVTMPELAEIILTNEKQRFGLIPTSYDPASGEPVPSTTDTANTISSTSDPADFLIRANQGHTLTVDAEALLTRIAADTPDLPRTVVHGTNRRAWKLIAGSGGLKTMGRNHVHFATGLPAGFASIEDGGNQEELGVSVVPEPVISGMRKTSTVLVYVDLAKAMETGLEFWRSDNGVILCDGGEQDLIPIECFKCVEERGEGGGVLVRDGTIIKELAGLDRQTTEGGKGKGRRKG